MHFISFFSSENGILRGLGRVNTRYNKATYSVPKWRVTSNRKRLSGTYLEFFEKFNHIIISPDENTEVLLS